MNKANELIETFKNIKPMLAIEMEEKLVKLPAFVQPKLDGIRCIIYKLHQPVKNQIIFQSRQNKLFEPFLHLLPDLEKIFKDQLINIIRKYMPSLSSEWKLTIN